MATPSGSCRLSVLRCGAVGTSGALSGTSGSTGHAASDTEHRASGVPHARGRFRPADTSVPAPAPVHRPGGDRRILSDHRPHRIAPTAATELVAGSLCTPRSRRDGDHLLAAARKVTAASAGRVVDLVPGAAATVGEKRRPNRTAASEHQ